MKTISAAFILALLAVGPAAAQTQGGASADDGAVEGVLAPTGELVAEPESPPDAQSEQAVESSADKALREAEKDLEDTKSVVEDGGASATEATEKLSD